MQKLIQSDKSNKALPHEVERPEVDSAKTVQEASLNQKVQPTSAVISRLIKTNKKLNEQVKSARGHRRTHSDANSLSTNSLNFSQFISRGLRQTNKPSVSSMIEKIGHKATLTEKFKNFTEIKQKKTIMTNHSQKSSLSKTNAMIATDIPKTSKTSKSNLGYMAFDLPESGKLSSSNTKINKRVFDFIKSASKKSGLDLGLKIKNISHQKTKSSLNTVNTDLVKNLSHSNVQKSHQNIMAQNHSPTSIDLKHKFDTLQLENLNLKKSLEQLKEESLEQKKVGLDWIF